MILEQNLEYARKLGADVEVLKGTDAAEAILDFAMQRGITQIFVGHSTAPQNGWKWFRGNLVDPLVRSAEGIDAVVYPH
jgi:two-component system, OmpR family, sensor histidine kinase KdpD